MSLYEVYLRFGNVLKKVLPKPFFFISPLYLAFLLLLSLPSPSQSLFWVFELSGTAPIIPFSRFLIVPSTRASRLSALVTESLRALITW